jgi:transposase
VIDGAMNGEFFLAYVEQFLAPTLKAGDIVIMDNLSSHNRRRRAGHHGAWRTAALYVVLRHAMAFVVHEAQV